MADEEEKSFLIVFRSKICLLMNNAAICGLFSFDGSEKWSNFYALMKMRGREKGVCDIASTTASVRLKVFAYGSVGNFLALLQLAARKILKIVLQSICAAVTSNQSN